MRVNAEPAFSAALDLDWKHRLGCITVYILWIEITCFVKPVHANGCRTRGKGGEERARKEEWLSKTEKTKAKGCLKEARLVFNESKLRPVRSETAYFHTAFWFGSSLNNTWSQNLAPPGSGMCPTASLRFPVSRFSSVETLSCGRWAEKRVFRQSMIFAYPAQENLHTAALVWCLHESFKCVHQNPRFIQVLNVCFFHRAAILTSHACFCPSLCAEWKIFVEI